MFKIIKWLKQQPYIIQTLLLTALCVVIPLIGSWLVGGIKAFEEMLNLAFPFAVATVLSAIVWGEYKLSKRDTARQIFSKIGFFSVLYGVTIWGYVVLLNVNSFQFSHIAIPWLGYVGVYGVLRYMD